MNKQLVFLKLGGSLITDKNRPSTALPDYIKRIAAEIASARERAPAMQLLLGHGSGSFGHTPAKEYNTRAGVSTREEWAGFAKVWQQARALNQVVIECLSSTGLPVISISPSSTITARNGQVLAWDIYPISSALLSGLVPVVFGDVVFDTKLGGTILSTEELFFHLAGLLKPARILIAGIEKAIFADFPKNSIEIPEITPQSYPGLFGHILPSAYTDVTGGMAAKAGNLVTLTQQLPWLQSWIFSGVEPGSIFQALVSQPVKGTLIHN